MKVKMYKRCKENVKHGRLDLKNKDKDKINEKRII
jgi:hypothetical protein